MALPVSGTFTTPARGSLRADHTEPAAVVAAKIEWYRRFFGRQVKNDRGGDVPLWSTLWDDSGRGGFPPVALRADPDKPHQDRPRPVPHLGQPRWQNPHGWWIVTCRK
ncbi:hypothetical protein ABZS68_38690 [Streptomyces sp. NPDC005571]|uniref:hypothetical protein n=1 Tax=Streptomyces sp. NPDC005571 TaxID=3156888 RepID=UPI0033B4467C